MTPESIDGADRAGGTNFKLDGLTNLPLARVFIRDLKERLNNSSQGVSLLIADFDHFGEVNGKYGVHFGDEVLRALATLFGVAPTYPMRRATGLAAVSSTSFLLPAIPSPGEDKAVGIWALRGGTREEAGGEPGTFDFLGLTYICARSRRGKFTVHVRTMRKRLRRGLTTMGRWCQEHRHVPASEQQKTLNAKLRGHYQYYGRPTNSRSIWQFYRAVCNIWRKWLSRRTRGKAMTWEKYVELLRRHPLLLPRIAHSWNWAVSRV